MSPRIARAVYFAALIVVTTARAQDHDLAEGEKLYISQCKICHGGVSLQTGNHAPVHSPRHLQLAMHRAGASTMSDFPLPLTAIPVATPADSVSGAPADPIAFAPPFGPNLRGIVGRPAGSVKGFSYSLTMLKTLKGMEWTEAALDVWITNTQAWVPGVYMFYKQPDAEIRRKIILYLKANP